MKVLHEQDIWICVCGRQIGREREGDPILQTACVVLETAQKHGPPQTDLQRGEALGSPRAANYTLLSWPKGCSFILPADRVVRKFWASGRWFRQSFQDFVLQDWRGRTEESSQGWRRERRLSMEPWLVPTLGEGGRGASEGRLGRGLCRDEGLSLGEGPKKTKKRSISRKSEPPGIQRHSCLHAC